MIAARPADDSFTARPTWRGRLRHWALSMTVALLATGPLAEAQTLAESPVDGAEAKATAAAAIPANRKEVAQRVKASLLSLANSTVSLWQFCDAIDPFGANHASTALAQIPSVV